MINVYQLTAENKESNSKKYSKILLVLNLKFQNFREILLDELDKNR